jgi:hypothetical protein
MFNGKMGSISTGLPLVEVTAPDGSKSLWVAAVAPESAVATVAMAIPENCVVTLSGRRLTLSPRKGLRPGEVRRVRL